MRVQIHADSANTEQIRELLAALAAIGKPATATVGLNGPESYADRHRGFGSNVKPVRQP